MSEVSVTNLSASAPETSTGSPGTILRRCREFHKITLEEASEATKVGISHLKSLENDQISDFANQAYLKGFLRIYATYLGLNAEDVARMYDKLFGSQSEKPAPARSSSSLDRQPRRLISLKKLLFPAVLLVVIMITATFFKRPPPPLVREPPAAPAIVPLPVNPAVQAVQSSVRAKKADTPAVPTPKVERRTPAPSEPEKAVTAKRQPEAAKGFILKLRVTQNGTLTSTVDGEGGQQYELAIGDVIEWKAAKKVTLELSNAGGVELELNGKPYKSLGPSGKPAFVELDADSFKP